jgi:hypothetical protein
MFTKPPQRGDFVVLERYGVGSFDFSLGVNFS